MRYPLGTDGLSLSPEESAGGIHLPRVLCLQEREAQLHVGSGGLVFAPCELDDLQFFSVFTGRELCCAVCVVGCGE